MPPSTEDRLLDILRSTSRVLSLVEGRSFDEFSQDEMRRMAAERYLEIVCEAARKLPDELKHEAIDIDWRKMTDFANRLRHAYHAIDAEIVWDIIHHHIPPLRSFAERRIGAANS
ncbi:MAG: DUF86 domain-containing protein [Rhodopseudomonas sp.]